MCVCAKEKRESAIITYTEAFILLDIQSSVKEKQDFSLSLSLSLISSFSFSSCLAFIQSSVMPSWCVYNSLLQSLIIFILYFGQILSTNDNHHQILKADVGQDITMSCIFDEDKIEQVKQLNKELKSEAEHCLPKNKRMHLENHSFM